MDLRVNRLTPLNKLDILLSIGDLRVIANKEADMKLAIGTIGMLVLASTMTAQAQILKCVGKDGKIEFASSCPPGTKQQETGVSNRPAPVAVPAKDDKGDMGKAADKGDKGKAADKGAPKSLADRDVEFRKNQKEKADADAKAEKSATESAQRKQACEDSRANLKRFQERQRSARVDPKTGERVFFEEQDYVRETANAERAIAENCK
jgi:hypothetical protein